LTCTPDPPPLHSFPTRRSSDLSSFTVDRASKSRSRYRASHLANSARTSDEAVAPESSPSVYTPRRWRFAPVAEFRILRELRAARSEERRVGKEGRCGRSADE